MKYLKTIIKKDINWKLDSIIEKHKELSRSSDGMICQKCGVKQGSPMNGFARFYCEHLTQSIDELLKKYKQSVARDILLAIS